MNFRNQIAIASLLSFEVAHAFRFTTTITLQNPSLLLSGDAANDDSLFGSSFDVFDPAATKTQIESGSAVIASIEVMNRDDAKEAIQRSAERLTKWKYQTTAIERSTLLNRWSELIKVSDLTWWQPLLCSARN